MDEYKNKSVLTALTNVRVHGGSSTSYPALLDLYEAAYQEGRQSLLRAAEELLGGTSVLDEGAALEAARAKQTLLSLGLLREWMALDPEKNRYDVSESGLVEPAKKYRVIVWRKPRFVADVNYHNFYGSSDLDALANAAQSVAGEVEEARSGK